MIENLRKHIGQLTNTGVRVAVVFRKIPNDENNCLIVETERLPDSYHDYLIQSLNSKEAVETNDFFEVLNRRTFPDGSNCLSSLHKRGFLRKEPVTNITMLPLPGHAVPLALINATIDKKVDQYVANQQLDKSLSDIISETGSSLTQDPAAIAQGLILQAELLEKDATIKREEAYLLMPELRPKPGRPPEPEEIRAVKLEERKVKRRERDRRNASEGRIEKVETTLNSRVEAKLKRDAARIEDSSKV